MPEPAWVVLTDVTDWEILRPRTEVPGHRIFCTSYLLQRDLSRTGIDAELWEDFFPAEAVTRLESAVLRLSHCWHEMIDRPAFSGALSFEGVSLTGLMEYPLSGVFAEILHHLSIFQALLRCAPPSAVLIGPRDVAISRLLAQACGRMGIPCVVEGSARDHAAGPVRHQHPGFFKGMRRLRQLLKRFLVYRFSRSPTRILVSGGSYASAFVEANRDRLACLSYPARDVSDVVRLSSMVSPKLRRRYRLARLKASELRRLYDGGGDPSLWHDGWNLWPLVRPLLDTVFGGWPGSDDLFGSQVIKASLLDVGQMLDCVLYGHLLLDWCRPEAVVVLHDSWGCDRAIVACAQSRGIPTAVLQHGIPARYVPTAADRCFLWGDFGRRFYSESHGEPGNRFVITGNPLMDSLEAYLDVRVTASEVRGRLGIPQGRPLILYIGQPHVGLAAEDSPVFWEKQLLAIFEAASYVKGACLVLRPHPSESLEAYEAMAQRSGSADCIVDRSTDLLSIVSASDLVVVWNSTVSIDALLLCKRVLILDLTWSGPCIPFGEIGGLTVVRRMEDLPRALDVALRTDLNSESVQRFLADQLWRGEVPPTRAIYDRLRAFLSQGPTDSLDGT